MPAFRNVGPSRHSGRLGKETPVIWDMSSGWPVIDSVHPPIPHNHCASPISHTTSPSPFPSPVPYPERLYKQELSPPCVPSSPLPIRKNSHSRRRDPGHIPRPRNAFIFFRSHYIINGSSSAAGQQNELSKSAAKVWNQMTEIEKRPFAELAAKEKREHSAKYPNYTYAPGRTKSKAKAPVRARKMSGGLSSSTTAPAAGVHKRRRSTTSIPDDWSNSATSPESFSGEFSYPPRVYRAPRAAAQRAVQRLAELPSPAPSSYGVVPTPDDYTMSVDGFVAGASPDPHSEFVPTADIPPLELTPLPREETKPFEPKFDISSVIPHVDILPEQFGFKSSVSHEAANSWLPPLPRTNEPESPLPFFYPDGQYEVSSVYPQAQQYPTQVPSVLLAGSFNFSYQPPAPASYVQQASYSFGLNGTMLEDGMGQGYGGEYDLGQYFDFDSLLSQA